MMMLLIMMRQIIEMRNRNGNIIQTTQQCKVNTKNRVISRICEKIIIKLGFLSFRGIFHYFVYEFVCLYKCVYVCLSFLVKDGVVVHPWLNKFLLSAKLLLQYPLCVYRFHFLGNKKNFFFSAFQHRSISFKYVIKNAVFIFGISEQPY